MGSIKYIYKLNTTLSVRSWVNRRNVGSYFSSVSGTMLPITKGDVRAGKSYRGPGVPELGLLDGPAFPYRVYAIQADDGANHVGIEHVTRVVERLEKHWGRPGRLLHQTAQAHRRSCCVSLQRTQR